MFKKIFKILPDKMTINKVFFHKKCRELDDRGYKGDLELQIIDIQNMQQYLKDMKNKYFHTSVHDRTN